MKTTALIRLITLMLGLTMSKAIAQHKPPGGCYASSDKGYNAFGRDYLCFTGESFELLRITDIEDEFGRRHFTLATDSLLLNFSGTVDSGITIEKLAERNPDSIYLAIRVVEKETHLPIPGVMIALPRQRIGTSTNASGQATRVLSRKQFDTDDTLKFFSVGYTPRHLSLDLSRGKNQMITIAMTSGYRYLKQGDQRHHRITWNKNGFILDDKIPFKTIPRSQYKRALKHFMDTHQLDK